MYGDDLFPMTRGATAQRPLLGLTILLVEDSRHASEAVRLMCQRSGARLRRADSLAAARRHMRVYRPCAAVVDIGLPDGSGLTFLRELAAASPRVDVIVATSGDPDAHAAALRAGADSFLLKPVANLAAFQAAVLGKARGRLAAEAPDTQPDRDAGALSLRDDLVHAIRLIEGPEAAGKAGYLAQFLGGIAQDAGDGALGWAAEDLAAAVEAAGRAGPAGLEQALARLGQHLAARLGEPALI